MGRIVIREINPRGEGELTALQLSQCNVGGKNCPKPLYVAKSAGHAEWVTCMDCLDRGRVPVVGLNQFKLRGGLNG